MVFRVDNVLDVTKSVQYMNLVKLQFLGLSTRVPVIYKDGYIL